MPVDLGVLLLIVPLCALVLAIMAEVLRTAVTGLPRLRTSPAESPVGAWRPGRGEG
jgi:hypothetical protein